MQIRIHKTFSIQSKQAHFIGALSVALLIYGGTVRDQTNG